MDARPLCTSGACVGLRIERAGRSGELGVDGSYASWRDGLRPCDAAAAAAPALLLDAEKVGSIAKLAVLWWVGLVGRA